SRRSTLSGRAPADVRARVAIDHVIYGGCHGLEIQGRGLAFRHPRVRAARIVAARRTLAAGAEAIPGSRVEFKGLAVSLHYRRVALSRRRAVRDLATREPGIDRKSTRLNSSHGSISYAAFCLKK